MFRRSAAVLTLALAAAGCASLPPRPADLTQLSLSDAATLVRARQVTSVELTQAYITRADANLGLNVYVTLDRAGALAAAQRADADLDTVKRLGRLHGVPLVVKDNTHVAGLPNTAGTPALRGFVPKQNAPTVQRLVDAGAVILGKTNMHELAFGISGYNEAFFTALPIGTRNAYDRTRFAGGSSSGTGAAIGARLAPVALYEAYDDLKAYLARYQAGVTVEQLAAQIASKDVKATYDGLVVPRKLPTPNGVVDAAPAYAAAMRDARPALLKVFTDTFQR